MVYSTVYSIGNGKGVKFGEMLDQVVAGTLWCSCCLLLVYILIWLNTSIPIGTSHAMSVLNSLSSILG